MSQFEQEQKRLYTIEDNIAKLFSLVGVSPPQPQPIIVNNTPVIDPARVESLEKSVASILKDVKKLKALADAS